VFKPSLDDRYGIEHVMSHTGQNVDACAVSAAQEIIEQLEPGTTVVAVDEAQFFGDEFIQVVDTLASQGIRVILAGLDLDFRGEAFGPMPQLMCRAEEVTKLHAICVVCGESASRTQRLVNGNPARRDDPIILVGAQEAYEARCREHHVVLT
jgi:thymidine kinase